MLRDDQCSCSLVDPDQDRNGYEAAEYKSVRPHYPIFRNKCARSVRKRWLFFTKARRVVECPNKLTYATVEAPVDDHAFAAGNNSFQASLPDQGHRSLAAPWRLR